MVALDTGAFEVDTTKYRLDPVDERLWNGSQPIRLSNKAFQLLKLLVDNPNQLLTKDRILEGVWGDVCVSEGLVKEYVHDLRVALGDNHLQPRFIETVRGRGYRYLGGIWKINRPVACDKTRTPTSPSLYLAVLAFANLSDNPAQEYFADGISEDITIGLSKNPHLSVISRKSAFAFKGRRKPLRDIGEHLDVQFVLEGSVRTADQHLRVTARLVDATDGRHLWAETYDREIDDIFAVQDEIVSSIVHALGAIDGAIERSVWRKANRTAATNLSAYDCYLQAQRHFYRRHGAGFDEAEVLYEQAIELDPGFARAYSALALLNSQRFKVYLTASFADVWEKTQNLARRALQLDPDEYLAHWVLGRLFAYSGRQAQGLAEFERALQINPNDANVLSDFSDFLVYCGRPEAALKHSLRAIRLNPNCPDWYWWHLGFSYYHLGRYDDAIEAVEHMTSPGQAHRLMAAVYAQAGRLDDARSAATAFLKFNPGFSISQWADGEPYSDKVELRRYVDGLRMAGMPD